MGGQDFQDFHHVFVVFFVLSTVHDVDVILGSAVSYSSSNHHHNRPPAEVKHMFRDLNGIRCPPCSRQHCAVKRPSKLHCKGGTALDVCGCCPVCAKIEDEHCGGKWNYLGTCDHGLFCQEVPLEPEFDTAAKHGVCRKGSSIDILILADEAPKETRKDVCQPKCTSDFCSKNPRAICSAFDNADQTKPCQEICQHTSCMACRFVNPDPEPCPKCNKDDFPCIKKFGRCVRKQSCRRRKFPCTKSASTKHESGKFQCSVPDCPQ